MTSEFRREDPTPETTNAAPLASFQVVMRSKVAGGQPDASGIHKRDPALSSGIHKRDPAVKSGIHQ